MIKNITLLIIIFSLFSCYSVKHLETDEYILKTNKILINNNDQTRIKNISKQEINTIIKQKPNKKILGFIPFHLWIYNFSNPDKNNWINTYLRKIGEKPVILNNNLVEKSINQIKAHCENNGYFTSSVTRNIEYKKHKAYINYNINTGKSYLINQVRYDQITDKNIYNLILQKHNKKELIKGDVFTYNKVNDKRIEIQNILQNNGYYKFSKDLVFVTADSLKDNSIELDFYTRKKNVDSTVYEKFYIHKVFIHLNISQLNQKKSYQDTILKNGYHFIVNSETKDNLKFKIISDLIKIKEQNLYSKQNTEKTYQNLSDLLFFKKILIEFIELKKENSLDCHIYLKSPTKMYYSVEGEIKRSADEGNLGISGYFQFGNNNLLKGAEKLNGKIKLSLENRQTSLNETDNLFNTKEISYEIQLSVPKLISPKIIYKKLKESLEMRTNFTFSLTQRQRPDFSSQILTQKLGYSWKTSEKSQHQLNLIELSYSEIGEINSFIQNQLNENPYLSEQFEDKFIPATNYIFSFNNQQLYKIKNYTYLKTKLEVSGNIFSVLAPVINLPKDENGSYTIFNNPYSQYIRFESDVRRYIMFSKENTLILRGFYGLGYSYQNSQELPIQKQFFSGGVNSIRAWEAFGLGPGSTNFDPIATNYSTGDIKLEFNIEYRFSLINSLKSAFFMDGGNIWSIKNDPRQGSVFKINSFMNDLAIGIGFGLRYDFDFFVIRLDLATPVRNPSLEENERWITNPLNGKFRYNLAIGYPF